MRLKSYQPDLINQLSEFELWVTPSLGEIRDSLQFKECVVALQDGFRILIDITNNFRDVTSCSFSSITDYFFAHRNDVNYMDDLTKVINVLLLATGKTDNNLKCQYPLYLRNNLGMDTFPIVRRRKVVYVQIPRVLDVESIVKRFGVLREFPDILAPFMQSYFHLILSDEGYVRQLYALGVSYSRLYSKDYATDLLISLAIFQSRGSITAQFGHIPEEILRNYMRDWGLKPGYDFNMQDIELGTLLGDVMIDKKLKKRKYDFIVPYNSRKDGPKLFIQSQYYAGDSGSVSHKVVDQTDATRETTLKKYPQAIFIEYLDGAGYCSSLYGDLKRMLEKPLTKDFIQIRTAPLKFRRILQEICFLTPMEIEHILLKGVERIEEVIPILQAEGYTVDEINKCCHLSIESGIIGENNGMLCIIDARRDLVIRYSLLDCLANYGEPVPPDKLNGHLCVSGYETYWGLNQVQLLVAFYREYPSLKKNISALQMANHIQWLLDEKIVMNK